MRDLLSRLTDHLAPHAFLAVEANQGEFALGLGEARDVTLASARLAVPGTVRVIIGHERHATPGAVAFLVTTGTFPDQGGLERDAKAKGKTIADYRLSAFAALALRCASFLYFSLGFTERIPTPTQNRTYTIHSTGSPS